MADKFLVTDSGRVKQKEQTVTSSGESDQGKIIGLGADGRLSNTMLPTGVGPQTKTIVQDGALSAGNLVNVYNATGTVKVRKADQTTEGKEANGFVLDAFDDEATATVYCYGIITGMSGLTAGERYYLATSQGAITTTPPSASGNVVQFVGRQLSTTELDFNEGEAITLL